MSTHRYPTGFLRPPHPVRGRMGSPLTGRVPRYILSLKDEDDYITDIQDVRHIVLEDSESSYPSKAAITLVYALRGGRSAAESRRNTRVSSVCIRTGRVLVVHVAIDVASYAAAAGGCRRPSASSNTARSHPAHSNPQILTKLDVRRKDGCRVGLGGRRATKSDRGARNAPKPSFRGYIRHPEQASADYGRHPPRG